VIVSLINGRPDSAVQCKRGSMPKTPNDLKIHTHWIRLSETSLLLTKSVFEFSDKIPYNEFKK